MSWAGELLLSPGWKSPRDNVLINILVPITLLGWHHGMRPVIILFHVFYEITKVLIKHIVKIRLELFKVKMVSTIGLDSKFKF